MTRPDDPLRTIATAQLEAVRGAAAEYIYECADFMLLKTPAFAS